MARPDTPQAAHLPSQQLGTPPAGRYGRRARRIAEIRAWRDQTRGVYGQPYNELDPPLVWNNKGWWRDVCDLLDLLDGKPWREDNDGA